MSKITVAITTYPHQNRERELLRCLDSVAKQSFKDFEVLILENNVDQSLISKIIPDQTNLRVICDATKRLSHLFNICWKNAETEFVAYLADDVEVEADWLLNIISELEENNDVGVVTGPIVSTSYPAGEMHRLYLLFQKNILTKTLSWPYLHFAMEDRPLLVGKLFESGAYSLGAGLAESKLLQRCEIDLATTSNMGIRRTLLQQLDGFDEQFSFNHADGDLFIRAKKAGYKILFNPKVSALHHLHLGPSRNAYFIGKDTALFYKKNIRPRTVSGSFGLVLNLLVLNLYWVYSALKTRNISQLRGILGFFEGFVCHEN